MYAIFRKPDDLNLTNNTKIQEKTYTHQNTGFTISGVGNLTVFHVDKNTTNSNMELIITTSVC